MTDVNYTTRSGLRVIDDYREPWGDDARPNWQAMDYLLNPERVFFVSPEFTEGNLDSANATSPRRFSTIQGAIDAWEAGGFSDGNYGGIYVYPGRYDERLTITKSVALIGAHGCSLESGLGNRGVYLRGTTAVAGTLITFTPPAGETHVVVFENFNFRNQSGALGSEVGTTTPMLLQTVDQGAGNYGAFKSVVHFEDCNMRLDNVNNNSWSTGIAASANHWVGFRRCRFSWPGSGGGYYVRFPFYVRGNDVADKWGHLSLRDCEVNHPTFSSPSNVTVYKESGASGQVVRSSFNRTFGTNGIYNHDGNPSLMVGLNDASAAAARMNIVGLNVVEW